VLLDASPLARLWREDGGRLWEQRAMRKPTSERFNVRVAKARAVTTDDGASGMHDYHVLVALCVSRGRPVAMA
jgi:hypothetical protein